MNETPIELLEYVTDNGQIPFREWLEKLRDRQARARNWDNFLRRIE